MIRGGAAARRRGAGRFIVLEGLDGAGTTTQAQRLAAWLRGRGRTVHVTAEPSGGPLGALARLVLTRRLGGGAAAGAAGFDAGALALVFAADRLDHVAAEIAPRLAEGTDVVSDRFTLSSLAYQSLTTGDAAWVEAVNAKALAPDVTIFLRVPARVAVARRFAASASGARELFEVPAFQRRVARSYERCILRLRAAGQRVDVVDGALGLDDVTAAVARVVTPLLDRAAPARHRRAG
ncbi:MAG: dTMP kinase [Anaeromyxobacteraceae bacterium]